MNSPPTTPTGSARLRPRLGASLLLLALGSGAGTVQASGAGAAAGEGPGEPAPRPSYPLAVACAPGGALYIADPHLPGIVEREPGGALRVVYRGSTRFESPLRAIRALALGPDGALFAADPATRDIYRARPGRPPEPLTRAALEVPTALAFTTEGDLIVADLRLGLVARVAPGGGSPTTLAHVPAPRGVAATASGELVVLSMGPDPLLRIGRDGSATPLVRGRAFRFPNAVVPARDGGGYLVSDGYAATVWSVSAEGRVRPWRRGAPLVRPAGMAFEPSGALVVADPGAGQIFRIPADPDAPIEPLLPPRRTP